MTDSPKTNADAMRSVQEQMALECEEMAKYALNSGLQVPVQVWNALEAHADRATSGGLARMAAVHEQLAEIIAPASPRTVVLLAAESAKDSFWQFLGAVPLARHMMAAAIISMVLFMGVGLSPYVNEKESFGDIFDSTGWAALYAELFLLAAAGLGASFAALFQINRFITDGTYDPKYVASYWIKFAMGLVAGILLSQLVAEAGDGEASLTTGGFDRPLLALVGGFSAAVVYRILNRLVETVESLVRGDTSGLEEARDQVARAKQAERMVQENAKFATQLSALKAMIETGAAPDQVKGNLESMLAGLLPGAAPQAPAAPEPPQPASNGETNGQPPKAAEAVPPKAAPVDSSQAVG